MIYILLHLAIGFLCCFSILWFSCDSRSIHPQVADYGFIMGMLAVPFWFIIMPLFILFKIVDCLIRFVEYKKWNNQVHTIYIKNDFNLGASGVALGLSKNKEQK